MAETIVSVVPTLQLRFTTLPSLKLGLLLLCWIALLGTDRWEPSLVAAVCHNTLTNSTWAKHQKSLRRGLVKRGL